MFLIRIEIIITDVVTRMSFICVIGMSLTEAEAAKSSDDSSNYLCFLALHHCSAVHCKKAKNDCDGENHQPNNDHSSGSDHVRH